MYICLHICIHTYDICTHHRNSPSAEWQTSCNSAPEVHLVSLAFPGCVLHVEGDGEDAPPRTWVNKALEAELQGLIHIMKLYFIICIYTYMHTLYVIWIFGI